MAVDKWTYFKALQNVGNAQGKRQTRINQSKYNLRNQLEAETELCYIDGQANSCVFYPNKNDFTMYKIEKLPDDGELQVGSIVEWSNEHWLITNVFLNSLIQSKGEMVRCNQLLKFQNANNEVCECWCVVEDPINARQSSYTTKIVNAIGTLHLCVPINKDTLQFYIDKRLLLWQESDKFGNPIPAVFKITEIRNRSSDYSRNGIMILTVQRDTYNNQDSLENMIADFVSPSSSLLSGTTSCEIIGKDNLRMGGSKRTLAAIFYSDTINKIEDSLAEPLWDIQSTIEDLRYSFVGNRVVLWIDNIKDVYIGESIVVTLQDSGHTYTPITKTLEVI